jgi:hypothetical protein
MVIEMGFRIKRTKGIYIVVGFEEVRLFKRKSRRGTEAQRDCKDLLPSTKYI